MASERILVVDDEKCLFYDDYSFFDIFGNPIFNGKPWVGFTRDYQEIENGWKKETEIENIDEYNNKLKKELSLFGLIK